MNLLFSHGRTAFKYGLIYLGLKKNDKIMLPEYICDVLLDPLEDLGIKPIFYQINTDFTTNWSSLKKKYHRSVKAIVVVNYFGFEEEKRKFSSFCKKRKIFLIEDNCHSLKILEKKNLYYSDIVFYSIRKVLKKTYSGGVLKINIKQNNNFKTYYKLKKYNIDFKLFINNFLENNFLLLKRFLKYKFLKMPDYSRLNSIKSEKIKKDLKIDNFSKKIFEKKKFNQIKKLRYKNYSLWKKLCKKNKFMELINRKINKSNIPWVFPVYVKNEKLRKKLFKYGWKNGYSITSWPSLPVNLINKRNKKIWNKLVCFNTDRAPSYNDKNFNNII
tara:strand:- start:76 stop:1062 length:987 start_codon:yes stop_codon:yes gene_type:complete